MLKYGCLPNSPGLLSSSAFSDGWCRHFSLSQQFCFATVLLYEYAQGIHDHEGELAAPQHFLNFLPLRHGQ